MKVKIGKFPKGNSSRKIDVEIERFDTYSVDHTLALIIYPMLLQLKETKHGVPSEFCEVGGEDYGPQDSFEFYKETHDEAWQVGAKRWDDVLEKMIWAFRQLLDDSWEDNYRFGKAKWSWKETDHMFPNPITGVMEPTYQMVDENPGQHWVDYAGIEMHNARIQEGLELFGKYFRNLWD
jgi:hypothetical protein